MSTFNLASSRAPRRRDLSSIAAGLSRPFARGAMRVAELLLTWHERSRQRHQLQCLSDHMLRDIGLSRADVLAEATKPFWQH
jgi:uncharacterized protein YjiS (DUF1127 family)